MPKRPVQPGEVTPDDVSLGDVPNRSGDFDDSGVRAGLAEIAQGSAIAVDSTLSDVVQSFAVGVASVLERSSLEIDARFVGRNHLFEFLSRGGDKNSIVGGEILKENNLGLHRAFVLFQNLIDKLGLKGPVFFRSEAIRQDFEVRLQHFIEDFEGRLKEVEDLIRGSEKCSNFSEDWKNNLRTTAYYAFFIHYGAKRKAEHDESGEPQDYVYHVVRSAMDNLMFKCRFFCEKTLIATMLHDVLEDWSVGMVPLLDSNVEDLHPRYFVQDRKPGWMLSSHDSVKRGYKDAFEDHFSHVCAALDAVSGRPGFVQDPGVFFSRQVSIEELVHIVTKSSGNKARQIVEMFDKIFAFKKARRFSAARGMMMKLSDRIDNSRTFLSRIKAARRGGDVSEDQFKTVSADTIYLFVAYAIIHRMWNIVDWLYDYLTFRDPEERERRLALRATRDVGEDETPVEGLSLKDQFRREFQREIRKEVGVNTITEGKHYLLHFRPVGFRFEDEATAEGMARDCVYEKALQNFVIFRCVNDNSKIFFAAVEVFKRLFPKPMKDRWAGRGEFESVLGRQFGANRMGVPVDLHGFSDKYGVGAWAVFRTPQEFSSYVLGRYNRGYFYGDEEAIESRARVLRLFEELEDPVGSLMYAYRFLDFLKENLSVADLQRDVTGEVAKMTGLFHEMPHSSVKPDVLKSLEDVFNKLVATLLMSRERVVSVVINGEPFTIKIPHFDMTDDLWNRFKEDLSFIGWVMRTQNDYQRSYDKWAPLVFAAPWVLGRPVQAIENDDRGGGRVFVYNCDSGGEFSGRLLKQQTDFILPMVTVFQEGLLSDEPLVRGVVATPSEGAIERKKEGLVRRKSERKKVRRKKGAHKRDVH